MEECSHGCVNHTHTRGDNCIVPQIPCCFNKNATNYLEIYPGIAEFTFPWNECNVVRNSLCTYLPGPNQADEDFSWDSSKCHANGTRFGKFDFSDGSDGTASMNLPNRLGSENGESLVTQFENFMSTEPDTNGFGYFPTMETTVNVKFDAMGWLPSNTGYVERPSTDQASQPMPFMEYFMWSMMNGPVIAVCVMRESASNPTECSMMTFICPVCFETTTTWSYTSIAGYNGVGDELMPVSEEEFGTNWNGDRMEDLTSIYEDHKNAPVSELAYDNYVDICSAIKMYKQKHNNAYIAQNIQSAGNWGLGDMELKAK